MIGAGNRDEKGHAHILIALEPGNIALIQAGKPIVKRLSEFIPGMEGEIAICFTPDAGWVRQQILDGASLAETLEKSLTRAEVFQRPYHETDRVKDVPA